MQSEGHIPFEVAEAGKGCQTYYKTVGDLKSGVPLVILHGGPGGGHEYLYDGLQQLQERYNIPLVFYDQIGCGQSTHLQEKSGDESFWTEELFQRELDNLIDALKLRDSGFDVFAHSWGGCFGSTWAAKHPKGLRRLVLANAFASSEGWLRDLDDLRAKLPQDVQDTIDRCHREQKLDSQEYMEAMMVHFQRHMCLKQPWPPKEIQLMMGNIMGDSTVSGTMYGPSQFLMTGTLRKWSGVEQAKNIQVPTLLVNGTEDVAQDASMKPFFANIAKVKWVTLEKASHFPHVDVPERFTEVVASFIAVLT